MILIRLRCPYVRYWPWSNPKRWNREEHRPVEMTFLAQEYVGDLRWWTSLRALSIENI